MLENYSINLMEATLWGEQSHSPKLGPKSKGADKSVRPTQLN
jgi:hypothetical protein